MKIKLTLALLALSATTLGLQAETLTSDTAVFQQADPKSPVITRLKAGTAANFVGEAPAGWRRVEVEGTFEAFVHTRDITKSLEVREGANMLAAPEQNAAVLTVGQKDDKTEIIGVRGNYCQVQVTKKLQGFIAVGATANRPAAATTPPMQPAKTAPTPPAPKAAPSTTPGRAVNATNTADLPRLFSGTLVLARRPLINPNPPYDYQLTDSSGRRFAYVDTKRLVLVEKLETYLDRTVVITGTVRNTVDGKDLVVSAEAIQFSN